MPRRRMMDYNMMDMRNPYGSRGGYVTSRRMRRMRDRRMDYGHYGIRGGEHHPMESDYTHSQYYDERNRRDYESGRQSDMGRMDYGDMRDMHYGERQGNFRPVEAMGYFTGYYGGGQDYARGGRYDYGYDYGEDYGQNLTKEELEHWKKKLMKEVDEQDKHFFESSTIGQKAKQMGAEMKHYNEDELALVTLMVYTDYCKTIKRYVGGNMDIYIELAKDWLEDKDSALKGSERLAVYYDCIIEGEDD